MKCGKGAAYDLFLSRTLKNAELTRADTPTSAVHAFLTLGLQAAAGVRQPLERFTRTTAGIRVLQDNFTEIRQAMDVPQGRIMASEYMQHFVDRCLRNGFVANALNDNGELVQGWPSPFLGNPGNNRIRSLDRLF